MIDEVEHEAAVARINTLMRHIGTVLSEEFARIIPLINRVYQEFVRIGALTPAPTRRGALHMARRRAHKAIQARHPGKRNQR